LKKRGALVFKKKELESHMKRSTPPTVLVSTVPSKIHTQHDTELLMRIEAEKEKKNEERGGCKTLEIPNKEEMEEILWCICQTLVSKGSFLLGVKNLGGRLFVYENSSNQSFLWLKRVHLWANHRYGHASTEAMAQEHRKQGEKYFGSIEKAWNEKYTITKTKSNSGGLAIVISK
jgi:hypothetical protein